MTPPPPRRCLRAGLLIACLAVAAPAGAGHELPFYPGYYPQEIKIETLAPPAAAPQLKAGTLHAYIGADPFTGARLPAGVSAVESLGHFLLLSTNPAAVRTAEGRCEMARRVVRGLRSNGWVLHPYAVTPFHSDHLDHFDLIQAAKKTYAAAPTAGPAPRIRARGAFAERLVATPAKGAEWDATLEDVDAAALAAGTSFAGWLGPPWLKEGWHHAYVIQASGVSDPAARREVDGLHQRLVGAAYAGPAERADLERRLLRLLGAGCERLVVGYTVRREPFSTEFSQGVENIAWDSLTGMNSGVFVRTVKLKDFPWNGWLRVGMAGRPTAAWNPIAGFGDPVGRLIWSAVGDPAQLPAPYGSGWVDNRVSVSGVTGGGVEVPEDALVPDPATGGAREAGRGKTARTKIVYRVIASAFHDNTRMTAADAVAPYLYAARWGTRRPGAADYDTTVDAATGGQREAVVAFRIVRVDSEVKKYSDITFTYVVPVIEVYLNRDAADPRDLAVVAPPWSPVPWHLMALMDEAVKRGGVAFSSGEAQRRGARWLDLARDPKTREALTGLVTEFAAQAWIPPALRRFVDADEAQRRWQALRQFAQRRGHFLVTNGPYQLERWTDTVVTLNVFRDFANPNGVGTFDRFAIPHRAFPTAVMFRGDRLEVTVEVERVEKFLREHRLVREPLAAPASGGDRWELPACRYVILDAGGAVVAAGTSAEAQGNRVTVPIKGKLRPGAYTALVALSVGENLVGAEVATVDFRVEAGS